MSVSWEPEFLSKGITEILRYSVLTKEWDGWGEETKEIQPKVDLRDKFLDFHFTIRM